MDRLTHAEVGGPYASREDAQRAIERGNFDQDSAELAVLEGGMASQDSGSEPRTAAWGPFETPSTGAAPGPGHPEVPELGQPMPQQSFPTTTKPAQVPGGSGGLPGDPAGMQFVPEPMEEGGGDPLASATAAVVASIRASNPELDAETLVRVASKAVAKLVQADFDPSSMQPHTEDPLKHKDPYQVYKDVKRTWTGEEDEPEQPRRPGDSDSGVGRAIEWAAREVGRRIPELPNLRV